MPTVPTERPSTRRTGGARPTTRRAACSAIRPTPGPPGMHRTSPSRRPESTWDERRLPGRSRTPCSMPAARARPPRELLAGAFVDPAVRREHLPDEEARFVAGEEYRRVGDLLRGSHTTQWRER